MSLLTLIFIIIALTIVISYIAVAVVWKIDYEGWYLRKKLDRLRGKLYKNLPPISNEPPRLIGDGNDRPVVALSRLEWNVKRIERGLKSLIPFEKLPSEKERKKLFLKLLKTEEGRESLSKGMVIDDGTDMKTVKFVANKIVDIYTEP